MLNPDPRLRWPGYRTACDLRPLLRPSDVCPVCGGLLYPFDEDGQTLYYCQTCGYDQAGAENDDGTCGEAM